MAVIPILTLFPSNDNLFIVKGLSTVDSGGNTVYLTGAATVTMTLLRANVQVTGATWPIALSYIANSNGDFQGDLPDVLVVTAPESLTLKLVADNGADQHGEWLLAVSVKSRTS